jgi:DNA-binding response OmpR family regulator
MKPLVFILDDEIEVVRIVETALGREGYAVESAGTIAEAERATATLRHDVYIFDLNVPDGNGRILLQSLRGRTDAGIIVLSGLGEETDTVAGLEAGADDYVIKPFRPRELTARVNAVFRRSRAARLAAVPGKKDSGDDPLDLHGLRLCPSSRSLLNPDGEEIALTTMEFDVLLVLARNRNRVLTRDQIMNQVKGQDWIVHDRAVDGLVSRLRSKLFGQDGEAQIKTVRGVGYMMTG